MYFQSADSALGHVALAHVSRREVSRGFVLRETDRLCSPALWGLNASPAPPRSGALSSWALERAQVVGQA